MVSVYRILSEWFVDDHFGETMAVGILLAQASKLAHFLRFLALYVGWRIHMSLLAVGIVAFDTIETPTTRPDRILGGSATSFSVAASLFKRVRLVGIDGLLRALMLDIEKRHNDFSRSFS